MHNVALKGARVKEEALPFPAGFLPRNAISQLRDQRKDRGSANKSLITVMRTTGLETLAGRRRNVGREEEQGGIKKGVAHLS